MSDEAKPKKGSGEHPAMAETLRMLNESERNVLPTLRHRIDRLEEAIDNRRPSRQPSSPDMQVPTTEWTVTIKGSGKHHTGDVDDADQIIVSAVDRLRAAGCVVAEATIEYQESTPSKDKTT